MKKFFLTFVSFLYYFIQLGKRAEGCRIMQLGSCISSQNLTGHVISRHEVDSFEMCNVKCYNEKRCVSYNLGPKSGINRACVLSYSDHVIHPGNIHKGSSFEYCFFENNPCLSNPCFIGSCTPDETFSTNAECVCFTDDNCYTGCNSPLGMQSGALPNASISASTSYGPGHEPFRARLHLKGIYSQTHVNAGVWASNNLKAGEYLQVDLGQVRWVSAVATQGRFTHNQWVTSYLLGYSLDGAKYKMYKEFFKDGVKVFQGNSDRNTVVKHVLQKRAIQARFIRFVVQTWYKWISMRAEIYGCSL